MNSAARKKASGKFPKPRPMFLMFCWRSATAGVKRATLSPAFPKISVAPRKKSAKHCVYWLNSNQSSFRPPQHRTWNQKILFLAARRHKREVGQLLKDEKINFGPTYRVITSQGEEIEIRSNHPIRRTKIDFFILK